LIDICNGGSEVSSKGPFTFKAKGTYLDKLEYDPSLPVRK